ncbi:MAG: hypothetical protein MJ121_03020 [Clostridia bacterium]|nr:hypothetical protein [Clostridia bacterium]
MNKLYVKVEVVFDEYGNVKPQRIIWKDGTKYDIDYITDVRMAPSLKSGGYGDRYTIYVCGRQRYLFFERNSNVWNNTVGKWFIEGVA